MFSDPLVCARGQLAFLRESLVSGLAEVLRLMAGLRIHTVMSQELVDRVDSAAASAGVSRGEFVRRAVEQALGSPEVPDAVVGVRGRVPALPPAEQLSTSEVEMQALRNIGESLHAPRVRSSAEARPFRPVPKKGEK